MQVKVHQNVLQTKRSGKVRKKQNINQMGRTHFYFFDFKFTETHNPKID